MSRPAARHPSAPATPRQPAAVSGAAFEAGERPLQAVSVTIGQAEAAVEDESAFRNPNRPDELVAASPMS